MHLRNLLNQVNDIQLADKTMISEVFIKRPLTSIVISVILLLVGTLSMLALPVTQYPDITPPSVSVNGQFIGADALTVEQTVATPVETQVNGSPGMAYITSNSSSTGQMSMNVTY